MWRLIFATVCFSGCAVPRTAGSPPPPLAAPAADPILAAIGLSRDDVFEHHLEQHPDADCRAAWRSEDLRLRYRHAPPRASAVVETARRYEGVRYVYGGTGADGLDCSAFVNRVYAAFGYDLPRTAREQNRVGLAVTGAQLAAGDLLFFHERPGRGRIGHVALYLGDGRFIHAARGKGRVTFDRLDNRYYRERFAGGRRLLVMPPGRYSAGGGGAKPGLDFASLAEVAGRFAAGVGPCRETDYAELANRAL